MNAADVSERWSTRDHAGPERYAAWEHQLNTVYCDWDMNRPIGPDFSAKLRHRSLDRLKIIDCVCDPCGASRANRLIGRDTSEILGVQLVVAGREMIRIGDEEILLEKGDIILWDNTRPMSFEVLEPLHKLSFIMPLSRFKHWLPASWYSIDRKIARGSRAGNLLSLYMTSLTSQFLDGETSNGDALTEATIGLIVNALSRESCQATETLRETQMLRVKRFIAENLDQPDLSPGRIADANRISVRYLHWLFEPTGVTVGRHIIEQRLQRCRRELSNPMMRHRTITDIAFSWGFQNLTHFSRRFKQEFELSPHAFRHRMSDASAAEVR